MLERLESLKFFRAEYLDARKTRLEDPHAEANEELIETLQDYEQIKEQIRDLKQSLQRQRPQCKKDASSEP